MRNRGENDSLARCDAESLITCVTIGPCRQVSARDDFLVTDELAHEGRLFHPGTLGTFSQNALLFLGESNGKDGRHSMTFVGHARFSSTPANMCSRPPRKRSGGWDAVVTEAPTWKVRADWRREPLMAAPANFVSAQASRFSCHRVMDMATAENPLSDNSELTIRV